MNVKLDKLKKKKRKASPEPPRNHRGGTQIKVTKGQKKANRMKGGHATTEAIEDVKRHEFRENKSVFSNRFKNDRAAFKREGGGGGGEGEPGGSKKSGWRV